MSAVLANWMVILSCRGSDSSYKKQVPTVKPGEPLQMPDSVVTLGPDMSALDGVTQILTVNADESQKYRRHSLLLAPRLM